MLKQELTSDTLLLFKLQDWSLWNPLLVKSTTTAGGWIPCVAAVSPARVQPVRGVLLRSSPHSSPERMSALSAASPPLVPTHRPRLLVLIPGCVWDPAGTGRGSVHNHRSRAGVAACRLQLPFRLKKGENVVPSSTKTRVITAKMSHCTSYVNFWPQSSTRNDAAALARHHPCDQMKETQCYWFHLNI